MGQLFFDEESIYEIKNNTSLIFQYFQSWGHKKLFSKINVKSIKIVVFFVWICFVI